MSIRLKEGSYSIDTGAGHSGDIEVHGGLPGMEGLPGPAVAVLAYLEQQSLQKLSDASEGKFTPFAKEFQVTKNAANSINWPPGPGNANQTGTGTMHFSYNLKFGNLY